MRPCIQLRSSRYAGTLPYTLRRKILVQATPNKDRHFPGNPRIRVPVELASCDFFLNLPNPKPLNPKTQTPKPQPTRGLKKSGWLLPPRKLIRPTGTSLSRGVHRELAPPAYLELQNSVLKQSSLWIPYWGSGVGSSSRFYDALGPQLPKQQVTGVHNIRLVTHDLGNWSPRDGLHLSSLFF